MGGLCDIVLRTNSPFPTKQSSRKSLHNRGDVMLNTTWKVWELANCLVDMVTKGFHGVMFE